MYVHLASSTNARNDVNAPFISFSTSGGSSFSTNILNFSGGTRGVSPSEKNVKVVGSWYRAKSSSACFAMRSLSALTLASMFRNLTEGSEYVSKTFEEMRVHKSSNDDASVLTMR